MDEETRQEEIRTSNALVKWCEDNGCKFPHLYFKYIAVDYRGICTNAPFKDDEIMLFISPECLITLEVAKLSPIGVEIERAGCRLRSTHSYVAAFLLVERENPNSYWKPYIDILPKSYSMMAVNFSDEEMKYLKGSLCVEEVNYRQESYDTEYKHLCEKLPQFKRFSQNDFFWARLVVLTRIFGITIDGKKTSAMVPMADMLNHKRPPETYWTFDDDRKGFTITATKDFLADEEVFDSYGRKCNTEFFLNYGFVAASNQYNECQLHLELPESDPLYSAKLRLLGRNTRKIQFPCDCDHENTQEALSFLRLAVCTEYELNSLTGGSQYYRPNTKKIRAFNLRNEMFALHALGVAAQQMLNGFDTTLDQDRKLLADGNLSRNIRNCIEVRACEKEVATFFLSMHQVLHSLMDNKTKNQAELAIANCPEINSNKHFKAYVEKVINPMLQEISPIASKEDPGIADLIQHFSNLRLPEIPSSVRRDSKDFDG